MKLFQTRKLVVTLWVSILLLSACATAPEKKIPVSSNPAVTALADKAYINNAANQYGHAAANLERALRIEPRNARLWHELAQVRLKQEEYQQAESLALRSNRFAGGDSKLRALNWMLIAESRSERGDLEGEKKALSKFKN